VPPALTDRADDAGLAYEMWCFADVQLAKMLELRFGRQRLQFLFLPESPRNTPIYHHHRQKTRKKQIIF
jgi:hypothetical protein